MDAAASHLVSPPGLSVDDRGVPLWDTGASAQHDTWLLSFVDILALLLTLFVLLLAYQNHDRAPAVPDRSATRVDLVLGLLQPPRPGPSLSPAVAAATGFAMPGEGLLPLVVGAAAREPNDLATADVEPAVSEPPEATPPPAPVTLTATDPAASTSAPAPQPATADDGDTAVVVPGAPVNPAETDVEVAAGTPPAAVLRSAPGESEAAVHPATDELLARLRHVRARSAWRSATVSCLHPRARPCPPLAWRYWINWPACCVRCLIRYRSKGIRTTCRFTPGSIHPTGNCRRRARPASRGP
jgi:hypothetical protein